MSSNALLDLYVGDALGARRRVEEGFVPMSKSLLTRVQLLRFEVHELQTRTALAAARVTKGSERDQYLRVAEQYGDKLGKEGMLWTDAIATLRRAGIRSALEDKDGAVRELLAAVTQCDAADLGLHAAAARVRLGELLGGDEGAALREVGLAALRSEDVKKPDAMVALFAP